VVIPARVPAGVLEESVLSQPPKVVVEEVRPVVRLRALLVVRAAEAVEVIGLTELRVGPQLVAPEMVMRGDLLLPERTAAS
jgi:hypothetical protein